MNPISSPISLMNSDSKSEASGDDSFATIF